MSFRVRLDARVGDVRLQVSLAGGAGPVALIGPNGAGKTSLLRWIAGHSLAGAEGEVRVDDVTLVDTGHGADLPPELRRIGYVPQGYGLFEHLRVVDNVAFGLASRGIDRGERRARATEMLERLDAGHLSDRRPGTLSGGERQKVALARALVLAPRLLLLDEPMAALDASARKRMRSFLSEQLGGGDAPSIVVTHDARDVRALSETVFVLEAGKVVQRGAPEDVAANPASEFVEEFFGT